MGGLYPVERGMDSGVYMKVRAHYAGVDGNLVPRMCRRLIRAGAGPAVRLRHWVPLVDQHASAIKQYQAGTDESRGAERIRGTRLHRSTFIFRCD